ncbi:MAG: hypothetical protein RL497_2143 [Pseudomonadota bacterium]
MAIILCKKPYPVVFIICTLVFTAVASIAQGQEPQPSKTGEIAEKKQQKPEAEHSKTPLETVEVTGLRQPGYQQKTTTTGTKTDTPIHETPASVQVISEQLMQDQGAGQPINTLLLNVSGVAANYGSATGNLPIVSMRGFDTGGYVLLDGIPQSLESTFDRANIEKIEILKGPASVLYGSQHNVGGKINIVTKKPTATRNAQWGALTGSWDFYRTWVDLSGSLNNSGTLLYRFDAAVDTAHSFRDALYDKNNFIAPSLQWNLTQQDSLLLMADNKQRQHRRDPGLPTHFEADEAAGVSCCIAYPSLSRSRRGLELPIDLYIGTDFDRASEHTRHLRGEWTHQFDEHWQMKLANSHTQKQLRQRGVNFGWAPLKGADGSLLLDDEGHAQSTPNVSGFTYTEKSHQRSTSLDLTGHFDTGAFHHTALVGVSVDDELWHLPPAGFVNYFTEDPVGPEDWRHFPHYHFQREPHPSPAFAARKQKDAGIYVQDKIDITPRWHVLAAYRQGKTEGEFFWNPNDGSSSVYTNATQHRGGMPRLGLVYEPNPRLALYASGSSSFTPNWGALQSGSLLPPTEGKQFEVGLKQDFAEGKANLNLGVYQIKKTNLASCAPNSPNCGWYILLGGQQSRGIELDFNSALSKQFRLTSALTLQKAEVNSDTIFWDRPVPKGQEMYAVPHWIVNVYGVYSFSGQWQNLELGGGLNATSRTQANLPNDGLTLPGTRRLDLMLGYTINPSWRLQLNAHNLSDHVNYSTSGWNLNLADTPRQVQFAVTVKL